MKERGTDAPRSARGSKFGRRKEERTQERQADAVQRRGSLRRPGTEGDRRSESAEEEQRRDEERRATHGDRRVEVDRVSSRSSGSIRRARFLESSKSRRLQGRVEDSVVVLGVRVDVESDGAAEGQERCGEGQLGARKTRF